MKVGKIISVVDTNQRYRDMINRYIVKRNEYDAWDNEAGVEEMNKQIIRTQDEYGHFLNTEI